MERQPLQVFITVDTETAEERVFRGRVCPPAGYDARVWGRFRNQPRELGIQALMAELERRGFGATFFVEALAHGYFGREALREVCEAVRGRGHDVQLHVHPNYRRMTWRSTGEKPLRSLMSEYTLEEQIDLLEEGLAALTACGVPRETLTAFRAGDYAASEMTWEALRRCGLRLDSSYNLCFRRRGCDVAASREQAGPFRAPGDVVEIPITSFREPNGEFRHLQLSAVSLPEMIRTLRAAYCSGMRAVTLVTHPFELFHADPFDPGCGWPNHVAWARLRGFLDYLAAHRADYRVSTLGSLTPGAALALCEPAELPRGSALLRGARHFEQAMQAATRWMYLACAH